MTDQPWMFREVGQIVERPRDSRRFYLLGKLRGCTPKQYQDGLNQARAWCVDQYGEPGAIWSGGKLPDHFEFFDEEAAFAFKMRWC